MYPDHAKYRDIIRSRDLWFNWRRSIKRRSQKQTCKTADRHVQKRYGRWLTAGEICDGSEQVGEKNDVWGQLSAFLVKHADSDLCTIVR